MTSPSAGSTGRSSAAPDRSAELIPWGYWVHTSGEPAVANAIARSLEAAEHTVVEFYEDFLGRNPAPNGYNGPGVDPGVASWAGQILAGVSLDTVMEDFIASPEFLADAGGTTDGFITRVYQTVLGRAADSVGYTSWVNTVNAMVRNGPSGVQDQNIRLYVAQGFITSTEFRTDAILGMYGSYPSGAGSFLFIPNLLDRSQLRRSGPPQADINSWLGQWGSANNLLALEIGFASSSEFVAVPRS